MLLVALGAARPLISMSPKVQNKGRVTGPPFISTFFKWAEESAEGAIDPPLQPITSRSPVRVRNSSDRPEIESPDAYKAVTEQAPAEHPHSLHIT